MIGNDVVDLKLAEVQSNWKRPRFLDKLFSIKEQRLILSSKDPFLIVWRLWSMKESAYKAHQRRYDLDPKFNPLAFNCQLISSEQGKVFMGSSEYETFTTMGSSYIHSEAVTGKAGFSTTSVLKNKSAPETLKNELLNEFSKQLEEPLSTLHIKKCSRHIPRLFLNKKELNLSFSISHHGRFSAFILSSGQK